MLSSFFDNKKISQLFVFLGAEQKDFDVFVKLLSLGSQPVSVIAKSVRVPRSSMYVVLERLKKIGLIDEFSRAGIKYVKTVPVRNLSMLLESKKKDLERMSTLTKEVLPSLESFENKYALIPAIKFYEGRKGVALMYEQMLSEGPFCAVFNPFLVKKLMPEYHFKIGEVIKENKWNVRELLVEGPDAMEYKEKFKSQFHKIKILEKMHEFESDTIINEKDKIYMISYGEDDLVGVEIFNYRLRKTQQVLFDLVWAGAK